MKNGMMILVLALLLPACGKEVYVPASLTNNRMADPFDREADRVVQEFLPKVNTVGLAIGMWRAGETHFYGYGEVEMGSGRIPDEHTFFEIGSITKTFTATALVYWLQQQGLGVESPVRSFLPPHIPVLSKGGVEVTFQHLLNHTSGLPYFPKNLYLKLLLNPAQAFRNYREDQLFDALVKEKLKTVPGTAVEYSNTAFGVLGTILALHHNWDYGSYIRRTVCEPLGLLDTKAVLNEDEKQRMAKGYSGGDETPYWESLGALDGAGVLRSTPADVIRYGAAQIRLPETALGKAMALCHKPTFSQQGLGEDASACLGWFKIRNKKVGAEVLFHDGGTGGFNTILIVDPAGERVLALFFNSINSTNKKEAEARYALMEELFLLL